MSRKKKRRSYPAKALSPERYCQRILSQLYVKGNKPVPYDELRKRCRASGGKVCFENFEKAVKELVKSGKIAEGRRGFIRVDAGGCFKAKVVRLNKTFGFIQKLSCTDEIFVPGKFLAGAVPGDIVMANKLPDRDGKPEAEVIAVIQPADTNIAGVITEENGELRFLADTMSKIPLEIAVSDVPLAIGDKVLAKIAYRGERHSEHRVQIAVNYGSALRASSCAEAIVAESGAPTEFSEDVLHEAKMISAAGVWEYDCSGRLDLRDEVIFTMDGAESKDLDDAVSISRTPEGYALGVHIADVSHYVRPNSLLDASALERGTSIYYADKVIPMLPEELSNGICSLNPGEDRLAFSALMELSHDGKLLNYKFVKSAIRSRVKGVYHEVNALLSGTASEEIKAKYARLEDTINLMNELADVLHNNRIKRGAPELVTTESKLTITNDVCEEVEPRERGKSECIIEEFMLTANEAAAKLAGKAEIPFVYRVHESPSASRVTVLKESLKLLNVEFPAFDVPEPRHFADILENAKNKPIYPIINMAVLRTMAKARYQPPNKGHFGLALSDYTHFTSPIRRYSDLAVHRILSDLVGGADKQELEKKYSDFVYKASQRASETEVRAMNIERDCENCYKAEYMHEHLGEVFEGIITSVTEFGFYAVLPNTVEGLVHITSLPEGNYLYDGYFSITDSQHSRTFRAGDRVQVICAAADVNSGNIDFEIADNKENTK